MQHVRLPATKLIVLILILTNVMIFFPVCGNEFVDWDDGGNVYDNPYLKPPSLSNTLLFWQKPFQDLYIPVTYTIWSTVAFISEIVHGVGSFSRLDPGIFHSANLIFHILTVLVVFGILRFLLENHTFDVNIKGAAARDVKRASWAAAMGALLFALHPVQVEPVAWVTGLKDILCGLLSFLSIWFYLISSNMVDLRRKYALYALASVFYILALLSKPVAVIVPFIAWTLGYLIFKMPLRRTFFLLVFWEILALIVLFVTMASQSVLSGSIKTPFWARPLILTDTVIFYLKKIFFPLMLVHDYSRTPQYVLDHNRFFLMWAIPLACLILFWIKKNYWLLSSFCIFLLGFLPVSGIISFAFQGFSTVADRYLYISMLGPAIAVSFIIFYYNQKYIVISFILIFFFFGIISAVQTRYWENTITLLTHTVKINKHSYTSHYNLGANEAAKGNIDKAILHYSKAIEIKPDFTKAHNNLGNLYVTVGELNKAAYQYSEAIKSDRDFAGAYFNMGNVLFMQKKIDEAIPYYYEALRINPGYSDARKNLAMALEKAGKQK